MQMTFSCIALSPLTQTMFNLQSDANAIQGWVNFNHMSLNSSKCKFMLISRKRNRMTNPPTITISGNALETVPTFKYLGLLFTSDLSWSRHIEGVAMHQSKENLGPIVPSILPTCRPANSSPTIYIHCTAPHGVCSTCMGPTLEKDQDLLESTQKFACKLMTKTWTEAMMSS